MDWSAQNIQKVSVSTPFTNFMSLSVVAKSSVNKQDGFDSKKGKSKHNTASKATQEQHLNSNSQDFIKSIGWECDKTPLGHTKHYS